MHTTMEYFVDAGRTVHDWADWALKAILVGVVALSVSYLKSLSDHLQSLEITIAEMKGDMKDLSVINSRLDALESHTRRKFYLMEKKK